MKRCYKPVVLTIFTVIFSSLALSQTSEPKGLVITGSVISVKPDFFSTSDYARSKICFEIDVYIQIRNDSAKSLIILHPMDLSFPPEIAFQKQFSNETGSAVVVKTIPPYRNSWEVKTDPVAVMEKKLAAPEPSGFIVIGAGEGREYREVLRVETGYKTDAKPGVNWRDLQQAPMTAEYPAFRLQYHLALGDALKSARDRWKRFGDLVLDSNGDYNVKSEVILNRLPD